MTYTITLTQQELIEGALHKNTLRMAKHLFQINGFLKIENLFSKELIQGLAEAYAKNLKFNEETMTLGVGTQVSHRRYIVPIPFTPPFDDPELYANKLLMPLMEELLGPHFILNTLGAISALPGSTDQHLHADYFPLFEEDTHFSAKLPPFAITFAVPLVPIDLLNGPTQIFSGSHLTYPIDKSMQGYPKHYLHGSLGSCYFWDYRTFHAGGSNHTEEIRSLLYMAYTRRWFKDSSNPDLLQMDAEGYEKVPTEYKKLFSHIKNIN